MSTALKLYGAGLSPYVRKVRICFAEKQIPYDRDPTIAPPANMPDWYEALHPLKRIPTLTIGAEGARTILPDSSAICAWAEKHKPQPALYPSAPESYARVIWLEEFADTGLALAIGIGMFRPILFNMLSKKEPDIAEAQKNLPQVRRLIAYLESQMAESGFLVGSAMSLADIAVCTQLINMEHIGYRIQKQDGAGLHALYERMLERESVQALVAEDKRALQKLGLQAPKLA